MTGMITSTDLNIYPHEVDARIGVLEDLRVAASREPDLMLDDERLELSNLLDLRDAVTGILRSRKAWDSATIVHEDHFTDYARDWANGISDLDVVDSYVNWERFADNLKMDYGTVEFDGATYYVR